MQPDVAAALAQRIRNQHGGRPTFLAASYVAEKVDGQRPWQGLVYVFDLEDHPTATRCFGLASLGEGGRVAAILLTHRHRDHIAGVAAARARYGAPVWGHAECAERLPIDRALREGDVIDLPGRHARRLRVLEAPGHARSHLVFYEESSRTLIAGDVVSGLGTVVIAPPDGNMRDYLATLARLRALDALTLIPGHGPPHRGVARLFDLLIEHRRLRESQILRALASGPMAEAALCAQVYADTPGADPALASKTLAGHLEKLVEDGRVRVTPEGVSLVA